MDDSNCAEDCAPIFQSMSSSTKAMGEDRSKGQRQKAAGKDDWQQQ